MTAASTAGVLRGGDHHKGARKLILFPQGVQTLAQAASRPATYAARTAQFDAVMVTTSAGLYGVMNPTATFSAATLASDLATFDAQDYGDMEFIFFFRTNTTTNPAYNNDSHFTQLETNLTTLCDALKDHPKFIGIFWDYEYYGGTYWFNYPGAVGSLGTLAETQTLAISRGKQLMNAILDAWPGIIMSVTHGPGNGESIYYNYLHTPYDLVHNDVSSSNELMAGMFTGMVQANVDRNMLGVLHDGGEIYAVKTRAHVNRCKRFAQQYYPANSSVVPAGWRDRYNVSHAQGIYDLDDTNGFALLTEEELEGHVWTAMQESGGWVWFYAEHYGWEGDPGKTAAPAGYLAAMTEGRRRGRL